MKSLFLIVAGLTWLGPSPATFAGGHEPILLPPISPDPLAPRTIVTPVLYRGDPAPGVPDATINFLPAPQMTSDGRLMFWGTYRFATGPSRTAIWFGQPGDLEVVAYEGMQAPGLPTGVLIESIWSDPRVSENGWIAYRANLEGPGIVTNLNHIANFVGLPGDIRKLLQGGDQAPQLPPGVVIDPATFTTQCLITSISDTAQFALVMAWVKGPGVDAGNDRTIWIGAPHGDLQVIFREGMEAPGAPGTTFQSAGSILFNDAGQVSFGANLTGPDVTGENSNGNWFGGVATLQLVARNGDPAPFLPNGIRLQLSSASAINARQDYAMHSLLVGTGVTPDNDAAHWFGQPAPIAMLHRKGDFVGSQLPEVTYESVGVNRSLSANSHLLHRAKYAGPGIDETNQFALYMGPGEQTIERLRDGQPAPWLDASITMRNVACSSATRAMNDSGDVVISTDIAGDGVTGTNNVIIWHFDALRDDWFPLNQTGAKIEGRNFTSPSACDVSSLYANGTGGSDGLAQSFNDSGQLGMRLEFDDGMHGVFQLQFRWPGDGDGDSDVDLVDFSMFQRCAGDLGTNASEECATMDISADGLVNLEDYVYFTNAFTGAH